MLAAGMALGPSTSVASVAPTPLAARGGARVLVEARAAHTDSVFSRDRELAFASGKGPGGPATHSLTFKDGRTLEVRCPEYRDWVVSVGGGGAASTGRLVSCRQDSPGVAVWYHGGPFSEADGDLAPEQLALLAAGYDLFMPHYPLSSDRQFFFGTGSTFPDLSQLLREGSATLEWAHRNFLRVVLVGESFGARVSVPLVSRLRNGETAVFINPFFGGPAELLRGLSADRKTINDRSGLDFESFSRIVTDFFRSDATATPAAMSALLGDPRIRLVYSRSDDHVDVHLLDAISLRMRSGCGVLQRAPNGHEWATSPEQARAFVALVECR